MMKRATAAQGRKDNSAEQSPGPGQNTTANYINRCGHAAAAANAKRQNTSIGAHLQPKMPEGARQTTSLSKRQTEADVERVVGPRASDECDAA